MKNPLLKKVEEQELACKDFGFYWENIDQLVDQITSECHEIKEALERNDPSHIQEEVGDLIQAAVSVAVFCGLDPETTLQKSIDKFQKRFDTVVELAKKDGHTHLGGKTFDQMMHYWNQAKKL